jgi:ferredoxin-NADP reductase
MKELICGYLATGTGIAPFISMLCDDYTYERLKIFMYFGQLEKKVKYLRLILG